MTARTGAGIGPASRSGTADRDDPTARWPWLLAFAVVLVALAVGAVVAVTSYRAVGTVDDEAAARESASSAASQFVRRANNFSSDRAQAYEDRVLPLLTTAYQQEWKSKVSELRAYAQQEASVDSTGEVVATGVVTADEDSATVLVVADTSVEVVGSPLLGALRWEVELFDVDGRWLVNDYRRIGPGGVVS